MLFLHMVVRSDIEEEGEWDMIVVYCGVCEGECIGFVRG